MSKCFRCANAMSLLLMRMPNGSSPHMMIDTLSPQIAKVRAVLRAFTRLGRVQVVPASQEQIDEARGLCEERSVPFGDTIHAVLAKDTGALLVTRDAYFQELRNVVPSRLPEEILWP